MLITLNKSDKSNSKYKCDMCKVLISPINRVVVNIAKGYENPKKKWDLCTKCFKKVEKAIEKYYEKFLTNL